MLTKETRIEQLLEQDDVHWRWRWGVWLVGIVVTMVVSGLSPRWIPFSTLVFCFPHLCLEWRKTKLLLTFNEDARYIRLIYFNFIGQWLQFVVYLYLVIGYITGSTSIQLLISVCLGMFIVTFGSSRWLQTKLCAIDLAHVTEKEMSAAKEARLAAYRADS